MHVRSLLVAAALYGAAAAVPSAAQVLSSNLLYYAIQPCRILDTRLAGGMLGPGTMRTVNVVGLTNYSAQGGFAGDCHIPGWSTSGTSVPQVQAFVVNIVAVGAMGAGDLRAWPSDQARPTASVLNFAAQQAAGGLNVANGVILPVRQDMQGNDITLQADTAATHVVADVVGYFSAETNATDGNLFIGWQAGQISDASGGIFNVGLGDYVLAANTSGCHDVAIGRTAMSANTSGSYDVAVGYNVMGTANSGDNNTAVGAEALQGSVSAAGNTAIGAQALSATTSGAGNIAVGFQAGTSNAGGASNNIDIGSAGGGTDSGTIRIGSGSQTQTFIAGIRGATTGSNNAVAVLIDGNGQLGTMSSSLAVKEDVHDMADASRRVLDLHPVTFRYKQPFDGGDKPVQYGLIAEEVATVFPELVVYDRQGKPETVKYHVLPALLLNELQRQARQMRDERDDLTRQMAEQRGLAEQASSRADRVEQLLAAQQQEIAALRGELRALAEQAAARDEGNADKAGAAARP
jgi:hypothetical protein